MNTSSHIAVIGGGAAGFFAAITARQTNSHAEVVIFEKTSRVLAKVGVSGGGRCNLTNSFACITDLKQVYPRGHRLMKRLFRQFDHRDTYEWFERHGVPLVTQADHCVFPRAQTSQAIINCLTSQADKLGIVTVTQHAMKAVTPTAEGKLKIEFTDKPPRLFDKVIVTTGGAPLRRNLEPHALTGHDIIAPAPSLFTLNVPDKAFTNLMGIVVNPVTLTLASTKFKARGPLLITHWGMSGPAVLKLSAHAARYLYENNYRANVAVNWINETHAAVVEQQLAQLIQLNRKKQMGAVAPCQLTSRLWIYLLGRAGLDAHRRWDELGRKGLNKLIETLTNDIHAIQGRGRFKDEFVTSGGISLQSLDSSTLESKVCPNLYFAGEVIDIDGITGGFNLQAAWTTGYVAGRAAATL